MTNNIIAQKEKQMNEHLSSPLCFVLFVFTLCLVPNEHLSSPLVLNIFACPFVLFSLGHCVVCTSSIYGFWLAIWNIQLFLPMSLDYSFFIVPSIFSNAYSLYLNSFIIKTEHICFLTYCFYFFRTLRYTILIKQ